MRALVTGAAGFIGSHLCERLLALGDEVVGVDCFSDYYDPAQKRDNITAALEYERYRFEEHDLATASLQPLLHDADVVFHLAAQAGVRASWAAGFPDYVLANIAVTQRLLEAARQVPLQRFVYASSSSVYGDAASYPTSESAVPAPHSPYGVTKLAGEHLVSLYDRNWGLPTTSLRYFSVYGPRQRPDMGLHKLLEAGLAGQPFPLFGDGKQVRDFTYVGDVVDATVRAAGSHVPHGTVLNVSGGSSVTMLEVLDLAGRLLGSDVHVDWQPEQPGDVRQTGGTSQAARQVLDWAPATSFDTGVEQQLEWHTARHGN